jgi:D-alanyl-D-alanine carboxypeptidase
MEIPAFGRAVGSQVYRFPADPVGEFRVVENTNTLLWDYEGTIGVKTGYTFRAGRCIVAAAERDGRRIYVVVMGSDEASDHFADAEALLDYGFESFGVVPLIVEGQAYGVRRSGTEVDPLVAAATVEAFVHIAGAGLFAPELSLVDGQPVLVAEGDAQLEAPVVPETSSLPSLFDALSWFEHWFGEGA